MRNGHGVGVFGIVEVRLRIGEYAARCARLLRCAKTLTYCLGVLL